jgi:oligopeptide transport system substrate-binding protein
VAHLLYVIDNARAFREGKIGDRERVGVKAADDQTLEVRLEAPTAYFPHLMAHPVAYPLPSWAMEPLGVLGDEPEGLVSNGPYRLAVWERGERLVLEKNARYRGPFPGNAHRVECRIFSDYASVLSMYADDELDIVSMIQAGPGTIARVQAAHGGEMRFTPQLSTLHLAFLVGREPFGDPRVRQAFVHAVDRERLVRDAWGGQYQPANGGFVPPGMPGHSSDIGLSYDPDRARRLLAEAGYPGGEGFPRVRWIYSGSSRREPLIPFLQRAWHDTLGLQVDAVYVGWQELAEPPDAVGLVLCGWRADYPDPDHMLRATFHSTEGLNMPGWRNARFDALVEEAARVADQSRRVELYREADRILVAEEAVVMPIGYARGRILAKPWVTAPRVPPALLRLKDVECSPERRGHSEEV